MKFKLLAGFALLTIALTGCTAASPAAEKSPVEASTPSPTVAKLADAWSQSTTATAALISNDLFHAGVCVSEPSSSDSAYQGGDIEKMHNAGEFRICDNTVDSSAAASEKVACAARLWISSGKDYTATSGQRSLSYEDGYDTALFYGQGWEVALDPFMSFELDPKDMLDLCGPEIEKISSLIGGSVTTYGQY